MFGMDWLSGPLLGAGLGAIAGGSSGGGGSSQSTQLDPRMANYVYGSDGQSGLLGDAQSIYKQQMAQGGLNDMQRQGMGMQYQYLTSPQYMQGAQSLYDMGAGLLSGGVAGNPFNRQQRQGMPQVAQRPAFQFSPTQTSIQTYKPEQRQQIPTQTSQPSANLGMTERSGGTPSTGGGSLLGTGRMTDAITDSSIGAFKKYLSLGLTPAAAAAAVQQVMATNQTLDAVNASEDPIGMLNAIQGWTDTETAAAYEGRGSRSSGTGYGNMGNGSYGGATGGYGGSYGSGSVGGW